jgi:hypothetical protein
MEKRGCRSVIAYSAWGLLRSPDVNLTMPRRMWQGSKIIPGTVGRPLNPRIYAVYRARARCG